MSAAVAHLAIERVAIETLKPHPRNYRAHPQDQIAHLVQSLRENGQYRPVVVSSDNVILAGHALTQAMQSIGALDVEIVRLPVRHDAPKALKVLAGDNGIGHLAAIDDRQLTELLKDLTALDDLVGTGYDEMMLANLVFVTPPASEVPTLDAAAAWAGAPEFGAERPETITIAVVLRDAETAQAFAKLIGCPIHDKTKTIHWPYQLPAEAANLRFTE